MNTKYNELFKLKIYKQILIIMTIVSVANVIGNMIIGYPIEVNIKWVIVFVTTMFVLFYGLNHKKRDTIMFVVITIMVYIAFPLGWYNSGLASNNAQAYAILLVIGVIMLFRKKQRLFLLISVFALFVLFMLIEHEYPQVMPVYEPFIVYWDRMIQIPLVIVIASVMLSQYANAFHERQEAMEALNIKFKKLAYTDALTTLGNRGYIFYKLNQLVEQQKDFAVMMIDLDNFKNVNDTYGHQVGDKTLVALSKKLKQHFANGSLIARYGGDEFMVVLFLQDDEVKIYIDDFLEDVRQSRIASTYGASISGGYGRYHKGMALDMFLREVDQTLYLAKGNGKNQILQANAL